MSSVINKHGQMKKLPVIKSLNMETVADKVDSSQVHNQSNSNLSLGFENSFRRKKRMLDISRGNTLKHYIFR